MLPMATPPAVVALAIHPDNPGDQQRLAAGLQAPTPHLVHQDGEAAMEPVMRVEITVPRECVDGVSFTLMGRRARIEAEEVHGGTHTIHLQIAMADMIGFAAELRLRTQGRAAYTSRADRDQRVSGDFV
jgi:elongation factor G